MNVLNLPALRTILLYPVMEYSCYSFPLKPETN